MLRVAIYHENQKFVKILKDLIYKTSVHGQTVIFSYDDIGRMIRDFSTDKSVDILIADAHPMIEGQVEWFELLELFHKRLPECVLVLTAKDGMIDAEFLKISPYRCLYERDISAKNVAALCDAIHYADIMKKKTFIWGSVKRQTYKISPEDILYVSIAKHGSVIHLHPNSAQAQIATEMKTSAKLAELFSTVGGCGFAYAHNSYFINLRYVAGRSSSEVVMEDGSILSISRSKGKKFNDDFSEYWQTCYG